MMVMMVILGIKKKKNENSKLQMHLILNVALFQIVFVFWFVFLSGTPAPPVAEEQSSDLEFYEEVWFIVLMCLIALLILVIAIAICMRRSGPSTPYVRERMPLTKGGNQQQLQTPRGRAASLYGERNGPRDVYVIDSADGRVIHANVSQGDFKCLKGFIMKYNLQSIISFCFLNHFINSIRIHLKLFYKRF